MQIITIAGNLTKDAEPRRTQDGTSVLSFSVAVNDYKKNTTFYDCSMFGKRGEVLGQYLTKGNKVTVSGSFGTREHNGKTYLTVNVNEVALQGGNQQQGQQQSPSPASDNSGGDYRQESGGGFGGELDDAIPF